MIQLLLQAVIRANAAIASMMLRIARFLTQMGSTRAEAFFWRTGAAVSAIGAGIVIATELGTLAFLLTISAWSKQGGLASLFAHSAAVFILGHFVAATARGIREPHHSQTPKRNDRS